MDERIATYELRTTLKDSFVGLAYSYDDTGQSEGWMKSILGDKKSERQKAALALALDDGVIQAQVRASMQTLLIGVQDRVMTETGVLEQRELRSANWETEAENGSEQLASTGTVSKPEIVEQPVWGIDCYTRRNISIALETEFPPDMVLTFVEKWLLPAINACPVDLAYDLANATRLLEGLPLDTSTSLAGDNATTHEAWKSSLLGRGLIKKLETMAPPWLPAMAHLLRRARENLGADFFRVHPKGHGSIVLCDKLEANRLVTFYRGEVYPSWRWGEKTDAISAVQERKGLKPVLPDFFNMALERPQHDPRGYGLLFVDASRKSGYGSMLSHSCQPSCEVRVVAVNGELRLAMTTLREMTIGDELTFDYNAVTESLIEFQSAVCLCGHGQCRGSFLHFATADCYQQVLNRNSPVAVRLANLVKGSTKKVMSEDDDAILKRHGFQTAAFGAISVNRRKANINTEAHSILDSMNIVPVWLRTYVADTLRYIEYERRALPIALICNDLFVDTPGTTEVASSSIKNAEESIEILEEDDKPVKGSKPEPTFFFYSRTQREYFVSLLAEDVNKKQLSGIELKREIQKLASIHWKSLDQESKEEWKAKAIEDWEKNGGREKAKLELQRVKKGVKNNKTSTKSVNSKKETKSGKVNTESKGSQKGKTEPLRPKQSVSFQQADAEGVSAMEQRIQQLTQSLSRIGRVLDRHRESHLLHTSNAISDVSDEALRNVIHPPLAIMPDEHVVAWMWNHDEGIVQLLLKYIHEEICVSPELKGSILDTVARHQCLEQFGRPWEVHVPNDALTMTPQEGRRRLNVALFELRENLLGGIQEMASAIKKFKAAHRREAASKRKETEAKQKELTDGDSDRAIVKDVLANLIDEVERRSGGFASAASVDAMHTDFAWATQSDDRTVSSESCGGENELDPWLQNFNKRFKIEKAADLLLLYAKTTNFFSIKPYSPLKSSPIEVYARELGNAVPLTAIDKSALSDQVLASPDTQQSQAGSENWLDAAETESSTISKPARRSRKKVCNPEDIISEVVVEYQGDYVLSQLLQWYNGGIGQKPGQPDFLGCIMLPSMAGCWRVDGTSVSNSHTDRATRYQSNTRRRLIDWFSDPLKRGNPWPDDIRRAFVDKDDDNVITDASSLWLPLGSPILDFLVTGDDSGMNAVIETLSKFHSQGSAQVASSKADGLLSSVDEGRPAQAVSNWVQCENPNCQKWRKVPWNVDIDMLSEQFFCKDNVWNPESASCDAPEDEWDETADAQVMADGSTAVVESAIDSAKVDYDVGPTLCLPEFKLGGKYTQPLSCGKCSGTLTSPFAARFDILRADTGTWCVGTVVKLDLSGDTKRVKVHYFKMNIQSDEWIDVNSPRLAPLYSKVSRPVTESSSNTTGIKKVLTKVKSKKRGEKSEPKPQRSPFGSRPIEISDDASGEQPSRPSAFTDESSMADVFLQDSDDDSSVHAANKVSILEDTDEDQENGPHGQRPTEQVNRSSLAIDEASVTSSKDHSSSKGASGGGFKIDNADDEGPRPPDKTTWTIPKKKGVPVKQASILRSENLKTDRPRPSEDLKEDLNKPAASPINEGKSGSRIPRKKPKDDGTQRRSLLVLRPEDTSVAQAEKTSLVRRQKYESSKGIKESPASIGSGSAMTNSKELQQGRWGGTDNRPKSRSYQKVLFGEESAAVAPKPAGPSLSAPASSRHHVGQNVEPRGTYREDGSLVNSRSPLKGVSSPGYRECGEHRNREGFDGTDHASAWHSRGHSLQDTIPRADGANRSSLHEATTHRYGGHHWNDDSSRYSRERRYEDFDNRNSYCDRSAYEDYTPYDEYGRYDDYDRYGDHSRYGDHNSFYRYNGYDQQNRYDNYKADRNDSSISYTRVSGYHGDEWFGHDNLSYGDYYESRFRYEREVNYSRRERSRSRESERSRRDGDERRRRRHRTSASEDDDDRGRHRRRKSTSEEDDDRGKHRRRKSSGHSHERRHSRSKSSHRHKKKSSDSSSSKFREHNISESGHSLKEFDDGSRTSILNPRNGDGFNASCSNQVDNVSANDVTSTTQRLMDESPAANNS